jgi:hypothetical protein
MPGADAQSALTGAGSTDATGDLALLHQYKFVPDLNLDQSAKLLSTLESRTGAKIRYFAADFRMMPIDNPDPQTSPQIDSAGIFYAPVKLAGQNVDDYVTTMYAVGQSHVNQTQYDNLLRNPVNRVQATSERLEYQQPFLNSMFYRAYVGRPLNPGTPGQPLLGDKVENALLAPLPGYGLEHFRLVYVNSGLKMLQYYPGAVVSGTITQDGTPQAGVSVTALDDAGAMVWPTLDPSIQAQITPEQLNVPHATTTTDASGRYTILAPFATAGGNTTLVVTRGGAEVGRLHLDITRDQAEQGANVTGDLTLQPGTVQGMVYDDKDGNGQFNADNDTAVPNENVTIGGKTTTTDASGNYTLSGVPAGVQNVTVADSARNVTASTAQVEVQAGGTVTHDVGLEPKPAQLHGTAWADLNDNGVQDVNETANFVPLTFSPDTNATAPNGAKAGSALADANGNYTVSLAPGSYVATASYNAADGTKYNVRQAFTVSVGDDKALDLKLTKSP